MRQVARALTPALTDVRVAWGDLEVTQAPHEAPPVFADGRVLLYGRLEEAPKSGTVRLHAIGVDGDVDLSLPLDAGDVTEGTLVSTLWARQAIRDLEEGRSALHARRGSRQRRALGLDDERVKAEIVRLGTTYGLVSRHTSFVAVETRDNPPEGEPRLRRVPLALTRGWHGADESEGEDLLLACCVAGPVRAPKVSASLSTRPPAESHSSRGYQAFDLDVPFNAPRPPERPIDRLVPLQCADGSWTPSRRHSEVTGLAPDAADRLWPITDGPAAGVSKNVLGRALATAAALLWLEREAGDHADEWRLLAEKAREWLDRTAPGAEFWRELAERILTEAPSGSHDHR
jgi:hypothetical protein